MRCSTFAGGGLLLLVSIAGAQAQVPPPAETPSAAGNLAAAIAPISWTGPYFGLQLGAGSISDKLSESTSFVPPADRSCEPRQRRCRGRRSCRLQLAVRLDRLWPRGRFGGRRLESLQPLPPARCRRRQSGTEYMFRFCARLSLQHDKRLAGIAARASG